MLNQFPEAAEALRRRMGMPPSGAGIPGGMPGANASQPMQASGMSPMVQAAQSKIMPQPGNAQNPSSGAISVMEKAAPGEAQIILKALVKRLENAPYAQ